jgi:hypothetical protein
MQNYCDDAVDTLRRILITAPTLEADERKQLVDYLKQARPNFETIITELEK